MLIEEEPEVMPPTNACSGDAQNLKQSSERHNRGAGTFRSRMWRGLDRRQNARLVQHWAAGAQRVTKPHSDESRARMEELMQRDENTLVQHRTARRQTPKRLDSCRSMRR